jgi:hypothetical protein
MVAGSAAIWMAASLIVAFPDDALTGHVRSVVVNFIRNPFSAASLVILFGADIAIAIAVLKDERMKQGLTKGIRLGVLFGCVVILLVLGSAAQIVVRDPSNTGNDRLFAIGGVALIIAGVIRGMSYCGPHQVVPVGRTVAHGMPESAPPSVGGPREGEQA